ncbi:MAG: histidinol-phosphate transaminase [Truepera sp.]|nr:histidinol-phosphate transaminase [Truepera sp.]
MIRAAVRAQGAYHFAALPCRVKLDQNESPYEPPEAVKARALKLIAEAPVNRYPELLADSLRAELGRYHGWPMEGVVVSNGSNVLIQAIVTAAGLGQQVLAVTPTFPVYGIQARLLGAELIEVPLEQGFALPTAALTAHLARGSGVFFLANPAAPTGNLYAPEELHTLLVAAGERWLVVIDEAYGQFAGSDALALIRRAPLAVSLRTFSKAFSLAGVRLGYALAQPEVARELQKALLPFSISMVQAAFGLAALGAPEYVASRLAEVRLERARLGQGLAALGLTVFPSATNFLLFKVADAAAFYRGLVERGVLIRRQDHLPGLIGCLRVTVGTPEENGAFLEAAAEVVRSSYATSQH